MGDPENDPQLRSSANDLNNLFQVITESAQALRTTCEQHPDAGKYYAFLCSSIERAKEFTMQMAARLGGFSDAKTSTVSKPEPVRANAEISIANPGGELELVMLIDDEEMVCSLVSEMLTYAGYRVVTVAEPFRALKVFEHLKEQIALVILDYTLPIMDGSEVFEELKKIKPSVAVMLSSGFTEHDKVRAMLAKGLRGFLPKPYTEARLLSQVRTTLDTIRSEKTGERRVL